MWKKGDKVVRIYGSNSHNSSWAMNPYDIGTVSEDQKYPGKIDLKEFTGYHDPIRLRRIKDFKKLKPHQIVDLYNLKENGNFDDLLKYICKLIKCKK